MPGLSSQGFQSIFVQVRFANSAIGDGNRRCGQPTRLFEGRFSSNLNQPWQRVVLHYGEIGAEPEAEVREQPHLWGNGKRPIGAPCTSLKKLAGTTRLELATSAVTGQRSNQLNYVPALAWLLTDGGQCRARTCDLVLVRHAL